MGEVTAYLEELDAERATALRRVLDIVAQEAPDAQEGKSYGMPALKVAGKPLISVIATKTHLSLFPFSGEIVESVADRLAGFSLSKGTIRFQVDQPLPEDVILDIVRARLAQIGA